MAQSAKVFLCHAGEQKLIFVEYLSHALRVEGISVFLDKESLKLGDTAPVEIFACLETVPVVVVVLSPEFVRKCYPMAELHALLKRKDKEKEDFRLLPVLYNINYGQCMSLRTGYGEEWVGGEDKPAADVLEHWAAMVEKLLFITMYEQAQFSGSECHMVLATRNAVIEELQNAGKLDINFRLRGGQLETPMYLLRSQHPLFGREGDVQQVKASLEQYRAAVIWGGPGEGKSSIAMEAGCQLWTEQKCPGGCFVVDMLGVPKDGGVRNFVAEHLVPSLAKCQGGCEKDATASWDTVEGWFRKQTDKPVLLLFDNSEHALPDDGGFTRTEFIGMLRDMQSLQCRRIMVLVTTRKSVGDSFGLADVLDLPALCSKSAEALLVAFAGRNIEWRKDDASKLVSICGSNPLALEILAGFIKSKLCTPQDAIEEATKHHAGIRGILDTMCHRSGELAARVSSVWLNTYLAPEQRHAVSRLSVFAGSFNAIGAAAVAYKSGCTAPLGLAGQHAGRNSTLSELHARARGLLQELVPLAVVRETAGSGQTWAERRYIMHPLVQEVAAGMLKDLGESEYAGAYSAFASYMLDLMEDLVRVKFISSDSLLTQQLMSDEFKNIRNLARVLLELIEEREPQHVQKCNCPVVAAAMRQRGNIKQALIVEQAIAWVQNDRDGAQ